MNGEFWLLTTLPDSPIVLDAGFHRGEFAEAALAARPAGRIVGFEPAASIRLEYLSNHSPLDPRISLESLALSNTEGSAVFHDDASAQNSLASIRKTVRTKSYSVFVTTIDKYCSENQIDVIDMLKIDTEGYDLQVLEGAHSLLEREAISVIVFEYNYSWVLTRRFLKDAVDYFTALPYEMFRLFNGFLTPLNYCYKEERFDHTTMMVCVSKKRLAVGDIRVRYFPCT